MKSKTTRSINKVVLNFGQNITLDQAEATREFKVFRKQTRDTIKAQVKDITDKDFINQLASLLVKQEANRRIVDFLGQKFVDFGEKFRQLFGATAFLSFFIFAGNTGGQSALDKMGIDETFNLENDEILGFLEQRSNLLIESVDNTTKEQIARIIEQGRDDLLTNFEIAQLIDKRFVDISKTRAIMIAHTELANAVSAVELETFTRNGVVEKRWVTSLDERVCPICVPLHNETVAVRSEFTSTGDSGFSGQRPPAHVNCRCFLEEVIVGFEPTKENRIIWTGK